MRLRTAFSKIPSWLRPTFSSSRLPTNPSPTPNGLDSNQRPSEQPKEHRITVLLDEGALDGDARFPSACAVIVGNFESVEEEIAKSMKNLLLRPDFRLEPGAEQFERTGFHHVEDNLIARQAFLNLLPRLDFDWWCSSNLEPTIDPYATLPHQFQWLIERILQKLKDENVHFIFEQNDRLKGLFSQIIDLAVEKTNYNSELVSHSIGSKQDRSLAIADYCIAIATQAIAVWMKACCEVTQARMQHPYRTFRRIEPSCSVLYSWDMKESISSRSSGRLGDRSYFQLAGRHHPDCSHGASSQVSS